MSVLKLGSKGSAVTELQKLLIKNGITGRNKKPIRVDWILCFNYFCLSDIFAIPKWFLTLLPETFRISS